MKLERKILIYSMFNNLLIAILKIIGGFIFRLNSLFADGIQTLSDFITDVVSFISVKVSNKKPTKYHPFGFGRVSYLSNLFIGILLILLSLFIAINAFLSEYHIPSLKVLILLSITIVLKIIAIKIMDKNSDDCLLLKTSVEESKMDLYASVGVFFIIILLHLSKYINILKYSDLIGTLLIACMILKMGLKIIKENAFSIIGEVEKNIELEEKVNELLKEYKGLKNKTLEFIKYGSYYRLNLTLELDSNLKLRNIVKLQKQVRSTIVKHYSLKIKYVNIDVTNKI